MLRYFHQYFSTLAPNRKHLGKLLEVDLSSGHIPRSTLRRRYAGWQRSPGDSNVRPRLRTTVSNVLLPDKPSSQERGMWAPKLKTLQGTGDKGIPLPWCRTCTTSNRTSRGPVSQFHMPQPYYSASWELWLAGGPKPILLTVPWNSAKAKDEDAFWREFQTSHV